MNIEEATYQPTPAHIRYPLERFVLEYYESDRVTLKSSNQWPGYYLTKTNQTIPCIFVEGEKLVPSEWKPHGIQCIITETPEDALSRSVGQTITVSTWLLTFTNFGFAESTQHTLTLREVQFRLGRLFPTASLRYMPRSEVALESLTCRLRGTTIAPLLRP